MTLHIHTFVFLAPAPTSRPPLAGHVYVSPHPFALLQAWPWPLPQPKIPSAIFQIWFIFYIFFQNSDESKAKGKLGNLGLGFINSDLEKYDLLVICVQTRAKLDYPDEKVCDSEANRMKYQ